MKYLIYFLFRQDGRVDDYVAYFLRQVRHRFDVIHLISNGPILEGEAKLAGLADVIQIRANTEFDVGAYKDALFSRPDEFWAACDEVTLANFTFFGPIGSLQPCFDWADASDVDFWGVTAHKAMRPNPIDGSESLPYHIQSHWISVRKPILQSPDFMRYWRDMPPITSYNDSVLKHESRFTPHFESLGYSWDVFLDDAPYKSAYPAFNDIQHVIEDDLPILKRRLFYHAPAEYYDAYDVDLRHALDRIDRDKLFPMDLIWDSSRGVSAAALYYNADMLRVVPVADAGPDTSAIGPAEVIMVVRGSLPAVRCAKIAAALRFDGDLHLFGDDGLTLKAICAALDSAAVSASGPALTPVTATVCAKDTQFAEIRKTVQKLRAAKGTSDLPVLFCVVDALSYDALMYGLRHVARDPVVVKAAQAEVLRNPWFGAAIPVAKSFGSPSDAEAFDADLRARTLTALTAIGVKTRLDDIQMPVMSRVFWLRPSVLTEFLQGLHQLQTDPQAKADQQDALVDALLVGGLPVLATAQGMITFALSNTADLPRVFIKAEGRARNAVRAMGSKNAFLLKHALDYTAQYQTQEGRQKMFGQVHKDSYDSAWSAAWKAAWTQAWDASRKGVLEWIASPDRTPDEIDGLLSGRVLAAEQEAADYEALQRAIDLAIPVEFPEALPDHPED